MTPNPMRTTTSSDDSAQPRIIPPEAPQDVQVVTKLKQARSSQRVWIIGAIIAILVALLALVAWLIYRRKKKSGGS